MPPMDTMTLEEKAAVAVANRKLSERRFEKFKTEMDEVKERTDYKEEDFKIIKALRKDIDETTDRCEEFLVILEQRERMGDKGHI